VKQILDNSSGTMAIDYVQYDLSGAKEAINPIYFPLLYNKDRYMVLYGGAGSGKSHFIVQKYLIRIMVGEAKPRPIRHKILALRKTQPAARRSVFELFMHYIDMWGLKSRCHINKTDMTIEFYRSNSMILCTGLDDPSKVKSIEGLTSIWLEEATEFTHTDFMQLNLRLRGKHNTYLQICVSFNPVECPWLKEEFFEIDKSPNLSDISGNQLTRYRRLEKILEVEGRQISLKSIVLLTTYLDNKFLDDEQKAEIEDLVNKDLTWYHIYALGQWGKPKGLVFVEGMNWDITERWPTILEQRKHGYGLDFGYANHPTGLIEVAVLPNQVDIYCRELLYEPGLTNQDIASKMDLYGVKHRDRIVADSAEPKSIEEIRREGFRRITASVKGRDSIMNGISAMKEMKIHVDQDSKFLMKEFRNYKWIENKDSELKNVPEDKWNHLIDPLRYVLVHFKGLRPTGVVLNLGNRYFK